MALRTIAWNRLTPGEWEPLRTQRRKALVLLVVTAVLWSSSGLFIKIINWQPLAILSARSFIAALVVYFYLRPADSSGQNLKSSPPSVMPVRSFYSSWAQK